MIQPHLWHGEAGSCSRSQSLEQCWAVICKLTTPLEAKPEDRSCQDQSLQPVEGSTAGCPHTPWEQVPSSSVRFYLSAWLLLSQHLSHLPALAEGNEETAGIIIVPLFEGCTNEKQTNKSGEFHVSFKCTDMQLLSGVGDQKDLLNSEYQSAFSGLIVGRDLLENFRRKLQKKDGVLLSSSKLWKVLYKAH